MTWLTNYERWYSGSWAELTIKGMCLVGSLTLVAIAFWLVIDSLIILWRRWWK